MVCYAHRKTNWVQTSQVHKIFEQIRTDSYFLTCDRVRLRQVNNSVTLSGKPMGHEEFLSRMVEALGIAIDRRPKVEGNREPSLIFIYLSDAVSLTRFESKYFAKGGLYSSKEPWL